MCEHLASMGEVVPGHVRDELKQHMHRMEHRPIDSNRIWPLVEKIVNEDSRVSKTLKEHHCQEMEHWKWTGRLSPRSTGLVGLFDTTGTARTDGAFSVLPVSSVPPDSLYSRPAPTAPHHKQQVPPPGVDTRIAVCADS